MHKHLFFTIVICPFFWACLLQAGTFTVPHIAEEGWHTRSVFYNPNSKEAAVMFIKHNTDGSGETSSEWFSIPPGDQITLTNSDFGYLGSATFITDSPNIVAKLIYQYGSSPSVCEFQMKENYIGRYWIIPSSTGNDFSWFGFAIQNPTDTDVEIYFRAHKSTNNWDPLEIFTLKPHEKKVALLSTIFYWLDYTSVDYLEINCSQDIGAPLGIVGNEAQDRHVFYNGFRLFDSYYHVSMSDISMSNLTSDFIETSEEGTNHMNDGAILVFQTSEGRYGKMAVVKYGYRLFIMWDTFNNDGSLYSSGSELDINGSMSCDLDLGTVDEAYLCENCDFFWSQLTSTERRLEPLNGALFCVWEQ